jgi:cell wall-associated NlpC family hydrolase
MPTATKPTAIDKLKQSRLADAKQMQLLGGDVDIDDFHLQMRHGAGIDVTSAITDAVVDRTVVGASTLTVSVDDTNERKIQRSGVLGHGVDVNLDGLWWTLTALKKQGRAVDLVFEEREVNLLRRYNSFIKANRDQVTRAQFVLRMIKEVQEVHLKWVIPELNIKQDVSDISQNQILVGPDGKPVASAQQVSDATTTQLERGQGIPSNANLRVRGAAATREQINNANIILSVGVSLHAPRKVMIASMMVAIDESNIRNLPGGDRDSVGVFQQRPSAGWPASRNVATDAAAFFRAAISLNSQPAHAQDSLAALCQSVQHSGTPDGSNYAAFQDEGTAFVDAFDRNPTSSEAVAAGAAATTNTATNLFMRGTVSKARGMSGAYILQKENSWNCMQRLAGEVDWRAFCVSGAIYFISDHWLFKSKPFMTISEDTPGIDWIDYDYDEGKHKATCTVTAHLSRWSAPPGSTVQVEKMGIIDGKYLVTDVQRSLYQREGTITLEKPLPLLPEPVQLSGIPSGFAGTPSTGHGGKGSGPSLVDANKVQTTVVNFAKSQLGVPYQWGAEEIGVAFDCSGLAQAAYKAALPSLDLPRVAQAQYDFGRKLSKAEVMIPGDLVFFGSSSTSIEHVGIYIGSGTMIDAPHSGANVRVDRNFLNWTDAPFVGASRPWEHGK